MPGAFRDTFGDDHAVTSALLQDGSRCVYYDDDGYTVEDARRLARALNDAADSIDRTLVMIPGGVS